MSPTTTSSTSVATAVDSCKAALCSLREEKVALIQAVLALKAKDREHWQARSINEQQRIAAVRSRIETANGHGDAALVALLQQRVAGHAKKVDVYQSRIALAITHETELRAMLKEEQRKLARLSDEEPEANEDEAQSSGEAPAAQIEELREELDLVRQMRTLSVKQDNNNANE